MDKFRKDSLTRFDFMKLFYESIMKACDESNIKTIDKKILNYLKTNNFKIEKIESFSKIPIPIIKTEEDYTKFTTFVMDLPQQIYENYKEDIDGILIYIDEF